MNGNKEMNSYGVQWMPPQQDLPKKRIVYLYHGCVWHGHQDCEKGKIDHRGLSSLDRYQTTKQQEAAYAAAGFEVVRVWECEWLKIKDECIVKILQTGEQELLRVYDNRIGNDVSNHRLVIGDALYGGRTEPFVY